MKRGALLYTERGRRAGSANEIENVGNRVAGQLRLPSMRRIFAPLSAVLVVSLSMVGCARGQKAGAPAADSEAAFAERAAQVAQSWRTATGDAGRTGFVPLDELTVVAGDPGFTDETKMAFGSGWYKLTGTLPPLTDQQGKITFPDRATMPVPLIGADEAYKALDKGDPPCNDGGSPQPDQTGPGGTVGHTVPGQCAALTVTGATLETATVRTSRGDATVPAWLFTVDGLPAKIARVAVAPAAITAAPVPSSPTGDMGEGLVGAESLTAVDNNKIGYRLGVGTCDTAIRPLLYQSDDVVVVGGSVKRSDKVCTMMLKLEPVEATLDAPLGNRILLDVSSGRPLIRKSTP